MAATKSMRRVLLYIVLFGSLVLSACTIESDSEMEGVLQGETSEGQQTADLKQAAISRMQEAIQRYEGIAQQGGWPTIPDGESIEADDTTARVIPLRRRLAITGDLPESAASEQDSVYDTQLATAVAHFQQRLGLAVDSLVGGQTLEELNQPVEERVRQLEVNLQRLRDLPDSLGTRFIFVNVPEFKLRAFEQGREVLEMPVIVGEEYGGQQTPLFSDSMEYVIFRPYWNVPDGIAREEIVPEARANPGYLEAENLEIVSNWGPDAEVYEITPANLSRVASGELKLRQEPGPENALGLVKFMFPNPNAIYLHGTPADQLFEKATRAFSHGCIRVERPIDLAVYVLKNRPEWTRQQIEQAMYQGGWQRVDLNETIPVHILYLTAYVDDSGTVQFREDLYNLIEGDVAAAEID